MKTKAKKILGVALLGLGVMCVANQSYADIATGTNGKVIANISQLKEALGSGGQMKLRFGASLEKVLSDKGYTLSDASLSKDQYGYRFVYDDRDGKKKAVRINSVAVANAGSSAGVEVTIGTPYNYGR